MKYQYKEKSEAYEKRFGMTFTGGSGDECMKNLMWTRIFQQMNLPPAFVKAGFPDLIGKDWEKLRPWIMKYIDDFEQHSSEGRGLFLYGTVGTGKSTIAASILMSIYERHAKRIGLQEANRLAGYCISTQEFLEIRTPWSDSEEEDNPRYVETPLLFLDDIDNFSIQTLAMKTTNIQKVNDLLNRRYNALLPTIITSNLTMDEIEAKYGPSIASRLIKTMIQYEVKGPDFRKIATPKAICGLGNT